MAIFYKGKQVIRLQNVARGKSATDDLYLVETEGGQMYSVPQARLTANGGADEIVLTEKTTRGNVINQPMLPLSCSTD